MYAKQIESFQQENNDKSAIKASEDNQQLDIPEEKANRSNDLP